MPTPSCRLSLRRRQLLLSLPLLAFAPPFAIASPAPSRLVFEAIRNGRRIGQQVTSFERRGDVLIVRTVAEMSVRLGPITLYRYRHDATERWQGGDLLCVETRTDQNGRMLQVSAERGAAGVSILQASGARIAAPAETAPFSHWNRTVARRPLFNPQDGRLLREQVSTPQPASILLANGTRIPTTRIAFRGDAEIQDDYDETGTWAGLAGKLNDGSTLDYRRL